MSKEHRIQASIGQEKALISANYIDFDLEGLNIIKGDDDNYRNIKNTQMAGQEISLILPDTSEPVLLQVETVQNLIRGEDVVTYTGHTSNNKNNFFTLSISNDAVMGKINYGQYIYIIKPMTGKNHMHSVVKLDKTLMIRDVNDDIPYDIKPKSTNHVQKSGAGSGRVDILFYYGSDVYWPSLYVSTIVSEMNAALTRSLVSLSNSINSVGLFPLGTTLPGQCKDVIRQNMIFNSGEFSNLDQDMVNVGADIAFVIAGDLSATGCVSGFSGRIGGIAGWYNDSTLAYAESAQSYVLGDLTALHEIGHVFGGKHSNEYLQINTTPKSARGKTFSLSGNPKQTLMGAYDTNPCVFTGVFFDCERIDYFSNPNINYNGVVIGNSSRDMVSWLNQNMPTVSAWRGNPVPPPNAPNPISSSNEYCYGLNSITWTAQSGATEYKMYKSSSSNFSSPVLLYNGSNTTTVVNVNSGTWYIRTKSCNSSGCSAYSNQVIAYRYNGCA